MPLVSITSLEILWHFSETNDRFVSVEETSAAAYAIRYSSSALVLAIATMFNSLDFAIATMTPFSVLAKGRAVVDRTMLFSIVENLPTIALHKAIRYKHLGAALSLMASTIGGALTIVISGLWFLEPSVHVSQVATGSIQSGWSVSFNATNPFTGSIAPVLFDTVQHGFVYNHSLIWQNDTVLPNVGAAKIVDSLTPKVTTYHSSQYSLTILAIQSFLNCPILPLSAVTIAGPFIDDPSDFRYEISAAAQLPANCAYHNSSNNNSSNTVTIMDPRITRPSFAIDDWFIGQLSGFPEISPFKGCPLFGALFGRFGNIDPTTNGSFTALLCTQHIRSVQANISYLPVSQTSLTPSEVSLDSTAPTVLVDPQSGLSSLSYPFYAGFKYNATPFVPADYRGGRFDTVFSHLVDGPQGLQREDLGAPTKVVDAMNRLYQKYMTYIIDMNYRTNTTAITSSIFPIPNNGVVNGTWNAEVGRLKLSKTSKTALQAMLGTMVLLGGLAYWLIDMRNTIYRNPYPIASGMALFAGSRLLRDAYGVSTSGGGDETRAGRAVKRIPVVLVRGRRFRLGWWQIGNRAREKAATLIDSSEDLMVCKRFGIDVDEDIEP